MSDYTPTTEEVRDSYRYSNQRPDICGKDFGLEFDRWLAEHERQVAEQALQRVRDRHQPCLSCLEPHCFVCEKAKWPCAEFRALEGDE